MSTICYPTTEKNSYDMYIGEHGCIHLESLRHGWDRPNISLSLAERDCHSKASEVENKAFPPRSPSDYSNKGG